MNLAGMGEESCVVQRVASGARRWGERSAGSLFIIIGVADELSCVWICGVEECDGGGRDIKLRNDCQSGII